MGSWWDWWIKRNDTKTLGQNYPDMDKLPRVVVAGRLLRGDSNTFKIEPLSAGAPMRKHSSAGGASGLALGPPTGERWRVHEIVADYLCDATVASRTAVVRIQKGQGTGFWAATKYAWDSDALTLTASQYGMLFLPSAGGGYCYKNTNDTLALGSAGKNPCPFILDGNYTEVVQAYYTANGQAGDLSALVLYYEVIP